MDLSIEEPVQSRVEGFAKFNRHAIYGLFRIAIGMQYICIGLSFTVWQNKWNQSGQAPGSNFNRQ